MPQRPSRSPVADMPSFDKLDRTHARMLHELERFAGLLDHLESEGLDAHARETAREICDFFEKDAFEHHAEEERKVFPQLLKAGSEAIKHDVLRLQQDHGWLEEDWRLIQSHLRAVADGYAGYDMAMLRQALPIFDKLYREHIALEEHKVYPQAREAIARAASERED